jgi:deoxyribose-phosphate aldolase
MKLLRYPEDRADILSVTSRLDYSAALVPDATEAAVRKACAEALRYGFAAVPVFPSWIPLAAECLAGSKVNPQLTVGFPSGAVMTAVKQKEAELGLEAGAKEIDMVLNVGRLLSGDYEFVRKDIEAVVQIASARNVEVKVIMEVGFLKDEEKRRAVELAVDAGASFVKTCTGFGPGRATVHDILILVDAAAGRVKVKASGGVLTLEDGLEFVRLGAERVAGRYCIVEQLEALGMK